MRLTQYTAVLSFMCLTGCGTGDFPGVAEAVEDKQGRVYVRTAIVPQAFEVGSSVWLELHYDDEIRIRIGEVNNHIFVFGYEDLGEGLLTNATSGTLVLWVNQGEWVRFSKDVDFTDIVDEIDPAELEAGRSGAIPYEPGAGPGP